MTNSRMTDFRKRQQKTELLNSQKIAQQQEQLWNMMRAVALRIGEIENRLHTVEPKAKVADWRSLAMMKMLHERGMVFESEVIHRAEQIQVEAFEEASAKDDQDKGLEPVAEGETAVDGMVAIAKMRVFKGGVELVEEQVLRTKIEIGANELFSELDDAVRGMKVGEIKRFPLNLVQQTDEGEIQLLGLRKRLVTKEEKNESQETKTE